MEMTVQRYEEIKAELVKAQAAELKARQELGQRSGHVKIGSKTLALDGYKLQITNPVNTSIYEPMVEVVREKLGDEKFNLAFVAKLSVSASGLKKLTEEEREIAEEAIVTSAGTLQLKIVKKPGSDEEESE